MSEIKESVALKLLSCETCDKDVSVAESNRRAAASCVRVAVAVAALAWLGALCCQFAHEEQRRHLVGFVHEAVFISAEVSHAGRVSRVLSLVHLLDHMVEGGVNTVAQIC